jgi:GntR family transcriptional regulator
VITIDPREGSPIYRQIIDQVKRMVMSGQLAPGEQLESVAHLAARVRIAPMTVSKAYSALVDEGLVERRRGSGLFVSATAVTDVDADRQRLLERELRSTAALLVQLDVAEAEATRRLRAHMRALRNEGGKGP